MELVELCEILSPAGIDDIGVDQTTAKEVLAKLQAAFVALQEGALEGVGEETRLRRGWRCREGLSCPESADVVWYGVFARATTDCWRAVSKDACLPPDRPASLTLCGIGCRRG